MEYALWALLLFNLFLVAGVLILILMEYALWEVAVPEGAAGTPPVLILILMEYALWVHFLNYYYEKIRKS